MRATLTNHFEELVDPKKIAFVIKKIITKNLRGNYQSLPTIQLSRLIFSFFAYYFIFFSLHF